MRLWIAAFSLGVFAASFIPALPALSVILLSVLPLLLWYWWPRLYLAAAFYLGIGYLMSQAVWHKSSWLPASLEQADLRVDAIVSGLPLSGSVTTRITARIVQGCLTGIENNCTPVPALAGIDVRLNDYERRRFMPGQHLALVIRLKRPHGLANPGGIDTERRLFAEGISAEGYIRSARAYQEISNRPGHVLQRGRQWLLDRIEAMPLSSAPFIAALTVGVRDRFSNAQRQLLMATGTSHLMVISGLHVGLVAWLGFHVGSWFWRWLPFLCRSWPSQRAGAIAALLVAFFYSALAGFSLPVQRALIMVCCLMCGTVLVRQTRPLNSLVLALFFVLLLDPLAVRDSGFWMSFGAVAILLTGIDRSQSRNPGILAHAWQLCRTQWRVFLGMIPLTVLLFGQVSLLAPVINLVAIPFIGLCIVPLCLVAMCLMVLSPAAGALLLEVPDRLLAGYENTLLVLVTGKSHAVLAFPAMTWWQTVLLSAVVLLWLVSTRKVYQWLAGLAVVMTLGLVWLPRSPRLPSGTVALSVLDVGQGLAVVIQTRQHTLVYDTGPAYSDAFSVAETVLLPYLRHHGRIVPDLILVSHADNDHAGGVDTMASAFPQTPFLVGERLPATAYAPYCRAGQTWQWDAVDFAILHPATAGESGNGASCVLRVTTGKYSLLLPGDIERDGELFLVRGNRHALHATVLIAPHHGSTTSSTPPFVRHVRPDHVVFTTGYLNRFDHPRPEVMARYRAVGSRIHLTSRSGAVRFRMSADQGVENIEHYRETHPRFWSDMP